LIWDEKRSGIVGELRGLFLAAKKSKFASLRSRFLSFSFLGRNRRWLARSVAVLLHMPLKVLGSEKLLTNVARPFGVPFSSDVVVSKRGARVTLGTPGLPTFSGTRKGLIPKMGSRVTHSTILPRRDMRTAVAVYFHDETL